ncbi:tetratricopeptide repeat protein [Clostridium sp. C8-1-8]|uniref:tetratricopeptide repeat protein n=1 Tax=Clostridium sp. C8-1-8 TaxID=2698831 RepID=UPI00136BB784|nr:tetratricopeptide repeat protein [Clostridium sp. C8-1-8]
MNFYGPNKKIKLMRNRFSVNQSDLESPNMTRAFISMMESGKRNVSKASSQKLVSRFKEIASKKSVNLDIDDEYFSRQPEEDARYYIEKILKNNKNNHKDYEKLIEIADRFNLDDSLALLYKLDGEEYLREKDYYNGFIKYTDALGKYKELKDEDEQAYIYKQLGLCKLKRSIYDEAVYYFSQAVAYSYKNEKLKETFFWGNHDLALVYVQTKEYDKCLEVLDKSILDKSNNAPVSFVRNARLIKANVLKSLKNYKEAIDEYFTLVNEIADSDDILLSYLYNNIGEYYYEIEKYDKSLEYISKAQLLKNKVDKKTLANTLNTKGRVLYKLGYIEESIMVFQLAIDIAEEFQQFNMMYENYRDIISIYEKMKDYNKIKEFASRFINMPDYFLLPINKGFLSE